MDKPKVFVTRMIPDGGLNLVREACDAEIWPDELPPSREALLEKVRGVEGLLALLTESTQAAVPECLSPRI